jgi:hypothetical protein
MRAVNEAVDEVAQRHGTVHLDVARDPAAYERRYWSVDRLHPNERGHRLIACRFHDLLAASGYPVGPGPEPEPSSPPPTRLAEFGWMATKGTAWLVRRSRDLVPALVALAMREWLTGDVQEPDHVREDVILKRENAARKMEGFIWRPEDATRAGKDVSRERDDIARVEKDVV